MKLCHMRSALLAGVLFCLTSLPAQAQSVTCIREPISVATVRGEGLAELMPPIVFTCSGGSEQTQLTFDLDIFLSAEVANPVIGPGPNDIDAVLVATAPPALALSEEKPPTAGQGLPVLDIIQCQRNPNLNRAISCTNVPFRGISRRYILRRLRARATSTLQTGPIVTGASFSGGINQNFFDDPPLANRPNVSIEAG
jgi:hypothetical protein